VVGGTVHVGNGTVIEGGTVLIRDGKISAAAASAEVEVPEGTPILDARGKHVTPGFVEASAALYVPESERRDLGRTDGRGVADAIDPFDRHWSLARAEGITTVAVAPGTSQGAGGLGAVLKLRERDSAAVEGTAGFLLARESHFVAALGTATSQSTSAERLEQYYRLRGLFTAARDYQKAWEKHREAVGKYNEELAKWKEKKGKAEGERKADAPGGTPAERAPAEKAPAEKAPEKGPSGNDPQSEPAKAPPAGEGAKPPEPGPPPARPQAPAIDLGREAVLRLLEKEPGKKLPIIIEAHRRDDLEYALLLKEEFDLDLTIAGATQGHAQAARLAAAGCAVLVTPVLLDRWGLELGEHTEANAARLRLAGVPVAISQARSGGESPLAARHLRLQAAVAVRGGLPREEALAAISSVPARILGLSSRLGTLEAGKDGDLVVLSGEPLDQESRVEAVAIDGLILARGGLPHEAAAAPPLSSPSASSPSASAHADAAPLAAAAVPAAGGRALVLEGARVVTPRWRAGEGARVAVLDGATVVVRGGKVALVAAPGEVPALEGESERRDLRGKWLLPGFVDAHSHLGIRGDSDDIAEAISEDLRVLDAFDPWDPEIPRCLALGMTAAAISPGSLNVVGGRISLLKLVPGAPRIRVVERDAAVKASLAPSYGLPRYPTSPAGAVEALEGWLLARAAGLGGEVAGAGGGRAAPVVVAIPSVTAAWRLLRGLVAGGPAGAGADGAHGAPPLAFLDGAMIDVASWKRFTPSSPVILGPYSLAERRSRLAAAAFLAGAGTPLAFATSGTRHDLLTSAVLAMKEGLPREAAVLALTANPAALYGAAGRLGAIQPEADADLVVWSGDPFSLTAAVEAVYIDGELVFKGGDGEGEGEGEGRVP
jgi:imidazolonepropionase-like amidohydrolase